MTNDLYAVVGHPISHSKSPWIHSHFARQTGEPVEYTAIQAPLEGFEQTVRDFFAGGGKGLNVTVPFKEQAWAMADHRTARAEKAGAANTLYQDDQGRLTADNTDGAGLVADLTDNHGFSLVGERLLVLGAGGAVRGVLGPLLAQGPAQVVIANRTPDKAGRLAELFAAEAGDTRLQGCGFDQLSGRFDLIINGTSASLQGELPPLPAGLVGPGTSGYDMMYGQEVTPFNRWLLDQGGRLGIDGLGMLVEQAAEAFAVWRGVHPKTAPVIAALRSGAS
ncbi:MAG: shikimate dehydrogenase [Marinobacter sp.]|uniref:shikimate dehydrogenase n=1 Tax=Marinobacter sp. TaxID=50741 RepID=UPI00299D1B9F|nr:shikimate dehydrogenase [Marinobacter sp.]MDX1634132.1 shikimate dehydrogenase [Marinobacter sp.]